MNATVKTAKLGTLREVKIRACSWLGADPEKRKKDRALIEKPKLVLVLVGSNHQGTPHPQPPAPRSLKGAVTLFASVSQLYGKLHI